MDIDVNTISQLSDEELFALLKKCNVNAGPITGTTRGLYEKKLKTYIAANGGPTQSKSKADSTTKKETKLAKNNGKRTEENEEHDNNKNETLSKETEKSEKEIRKSKRASVVDNSRDNEILKQLTNNSTLIQQASSSAITNSPKVKLRENFFENENDNLNQKNSKTIQSITNSPKIKSKDELFKTQTRQISLNDIDASIIKSNLNETMENRYLANSGRVNSASIQSLTDSPKAKSRDEIYKTLTRQINSDIESNKLNTNAEKVVNPRDGLGLLNSPKIKSREETYRIHTTHEYNSTETSNNLANNDAFKGRRMLNDHNDQQQQKLINSPKTKPREEIYKALMKESESLSLKSTKNESNESEIRTNYKAKDDLRANQDFRVNSLTSIETIDSMRQNNLKTEYSHQQREINDTRSSTLTNSSYNHESTFSRNDETIVKSIDAIKPDKFFNRLNRYGLVTEQAIEIKNTSFNQSPLTKPIAVRQLTTHHHLNAQEKQMLKLIDNTTNKFESSARKIETLSNAVKQNNTQDKFANNNEKTLTNKPKEEDRSLNINNFIIVAVITMCVFVIFLLFEEKFSRPKLDL